MITVNITKKIRTYHGLHQLAITTEFEQAQITQVIGDSGVGKTTLLKILAGLVPVEQGTILIGDEVWLDSSQKICLPPQQRQVGFVFQDYALFPHMTVAEHLAYGTTDLAYSRQLLAIGRMENFTSHRPGQLSGGQQQRLAILRALCTKPRLLLMDEPFSALDYKLKSSMVRDLKQLIGELRLTCLVVTYQPFLPGEFSAHTYEITG